MTETEWLACPDRDLLLDHIAMPLNSRKMRLFVIAVTRRIWHLLTDERCRNAIELFEQIVENETGLIEKLDFIAPRLVKEAVMAACKGDPPIARATIRAVFATRSERLHEIKYQASAVAQMAAQASSQRVELRAEMQAQCRILRDLFGNPFRPVAVSPDWLRWREGTIRSMARQIYKDRRFDDLPIFGDALEDAGCDNTDLLKHCRSDGEHVRGCWAVDLLLG